MTKTPLKDLEAEAFAMFIKKIEEKKNVAKKSMWSQAHPNVQKYVNENASFQGDVSESYIADLLTTNTNTVFYQQKSFNNKTQIDVVSENGLMISVKSSAIAIKKRGRSGESGPASKQFTFAGLELEEYRPEQLVICIGILPTEIKYWTLDLNYFRENKDNKTIPGLQVSTDKSGNKKYILAITQERKQTRKDYDMTWLDEYEGVDKMIKTVNHHLNLLKTDI